MLHIYIIELNNAELYSVYSDFIFSLGEICT